MKKGYLLFLSLLGFFSPSIAQLNYGDLRVNIISNIYQNPNHAVSGTALQGVLLNQNTSYLNRKSDSDYVSLFDTNTTYYAGLKVIHGDTIYSSNTTSKGVWNLNNFTVVQVIGGGNTLPPNTFGVLKNDGFGRLSWIPTLTNASGTAVDWIGSTLQFNGNVTLDWRNQQLVEPFAVTQLSWANGVNPTVNNDIMSKGYADAHYGSQVQQMVKVTVDLSSTANYSFSLVGAINFIDNIVVTNASGTPTTASDGEFWDNSGRIGTEYFSIGQGIVLTPPFNSLTTSNMFIDMARQTTVSQVIFSTVPGTLYYTNGVLEPIPLTVDMYIYYHVIQ